MKILEYLKALKINYKLVEHKPVFTTEQAKFIKKIIDGEGVKNLFIKSKTKYYLVLIKENKKANLKIIKEILNESGLSFCNINDLNNILKIKSGSVSPLNIRNDDLKKTIILIDKELENKKILCHPNDNTKTINIEFNDLLKFINSTNHKYIII